MRTAKNKSKGARTRKSGSTKRARGKLAPGAIARGLDAADVVIAMDSAEIADVCALIQSARGALIGGYRDPLGGRPRLPPRNSISNRCRMRTLRGWRSALAPKADPLGIRGAHAKVHGAKVLGLESRDSFLNQSK
jgi:hypothetical protein